MAALRALGDDIDAQLELAHHLGLDAPAGQRCLSGREPDCALTKQLTGVDLLDTMTSIN